jgi:hypothetical protein
MSVTKGLPTDAVSAGLSWAIHMEVDRVPRLMANTADIFIKLCFIIRMLFLFFKWQRNYFLRHFDVYKLMKGWGIIILRQL